MIDGIVSAYGRWSEASQLAFAFFLGLLALLVLRMLLNFLRDGLRCLAVLVRGYPPQEEDVRVHGLGPNERLIMMPLHHVHHHAEGEEEEDEEEPSCPNLDNKTGRCLKEGGCAAPEECAGQVELFNKKIEPLNMELSS